MYRLTLLMAGCLLMGTLSATAQNIPAKTVDRVDSITWQLYQSGDWDGVLRETRASLRHSIDFYYLRVRAGKAAYEKKQYRLAAHHFQKAYAQNPNDDFVNYWYYYSLWLDGREDEADALFAAIGQATAQRLGLAPRSGVSYVLAEAQYSANRDAKALSESGWDTSPAYLAYRGVYREQTYKAVGLDHRVTPTFHLFHGLSHLGIQRTHIFQPMTGNALLYEGKASQVQYFVQGRIQLRPRTSLQASATLLGGYSDGALYSPPNGNGNGNGNGNFNAILVPSRYDIRDRQATVGITTAGTWLEPSLGFTVGRVGGYTQTQATGRLTVYPLRNANLSVATQFDMHHDGSMGIDDRWKPVLQQHVTLKTGPVWWIAEAASGDIRNFTTLGGYVVYNQPETIRQITGLSLYVPLFGYKLDLTLRYRLLQKEGMDFDYPTTDTFTTRPYEYNDDSFLVSIRWHL